MSKRKLKTLTISEKLKIVDLVEANPSRPWKQIAAEVGIPESTLSRILSKKADIASAAANNSKSKRLRLCEYPALEELPMYEHILDVRAYLYYSTIQINLFKYFFGGRPRTF